MKQETYDSFLKDIRSKYGICNAITRRIVDCLEPDFGDPIQNPIYPVIHKDVLNELNKAFTLEQINEANTKQAQNEAKK